VRINGVALPEASTRPDLSKWRWLAARGRTDRTDRSSLLGPAVWRYTTLLVIDAANMIGSRPTGWWRDRSSATRHFTERVLATVTAGRLGGPVTIVVEGRARVGADDADVDGVEVVHAPDEGDCDVVVVTADRELAERVRAANAGAVGPS
jgi:hypothetical protein